MSQRVDVRRREEEEATGGKKEDVKVYVGRSGQAAGTPVAKKRKRKERW